MKYIDYINNLSDKDLAGLLVKEIAHEDYDWAYDGEDEYIDYVGLNYSYETTDGEEFGYKEDAIEWQIKLLKSEYKGEK